MRQVIYAVSALMGMLILSLNMGRGARVTAHRVFLNEVETQLAGVAYDVLENIERRGVAFDEATDESQFPKPIKFPVVNDASELTPASDFGGCSDYSLCNDVDDFHGLTITRYTQGTQYEITLSVRYVDENDPTVQSPGQSFVKEISVMVTNPSVRINGEPVSVVIPRIVSYHRITWKKGIWL